MFQKRFGNICCSVVLAIVIGSSRHARAQANLWRMTPETPPASGTDAVSSGVRAARDDFFDTVLGQKTKGGGSVWEAVAPTPPGEDLADGTSVVLIEFKDHRTLLSTSRRSVYTEVTINVEQVLRDPTGTIQPGKTLTVILGGGTIQLPSGKIFRQHLVEDREYGIQPGHRYLAFLDYQKAGDFFLYYKSWELAAGKVLPNSASDAARAKKGASRFAGMSESEFIPAIKDALASSGR